MLANYHYVVTAFALTMWTRAPWGVLLGYYIFQTLVFTAWGDVSAAIEQWGFQSMLVALCVFAGYLFGLVAGGAPRMVYFWRPDYLGMVTKFVFYVAAFAAAQLPYALLAPVLYGTDPFKFTVAGNAWGLVLTIGLQVLVHIIFYFWIVVGERKHMQAWPQSEFTRFFVTWSAVLLVGVNALYFLCYVLAEVWVSFIAAGALVLGALAWVAVRELPGGQQPPVSVAHVAHNERYGSLTRPIIGN